MTKVELLYLLIGIFTGGFIGIFIMCALYINKYHELKEQLSDLTDRIIEMCFDDDNEDVEDDSLYYRLEANNYDFWKEVFCRKLVKYGYVELKDDYYKVKEDDTNERTR